MDPSEETAKKYRSVTSHANNEMICGNCTVVSSDFVDRSHIYARFSTSHMHTEEARTLTEWSADAVITRQLGKTPTPQAMSVTGRVWSVSVQYGAGRSA